MQRNISFPVYHRCEKGKSGIAVGIGLRSSRGTDRPMKCYNQDPTVIGEHVDNALMEKIWLNRTHIRRHP